MVVPVPQVEKHCNNPFQKTFPVHIGEEIHGNRKHLHPCEALLLNRNMYSIVNILLCKIQKQNLVSKLWADSKLAFVETSGQFPIWTQNGLFQGFSAKGWMESFLSTPLSPYIGRTLESIDRLRSIFHPHNPCPSLLMEYILGYRNWTKCIEWVKLIYESTQNFKKR